MIFITYTTGIDDGAQNLNEIKLIKKMKKLGFSKLLALHTYPGLYNNTNESIKKSFNSVVKKIPKDIKIEYCSEYMIEKVLLKRQKNKAFMY